MRAPHVVAALCPGVAAAATTRRLIVTMGASRLNAFAALVERVKQHAKAEHRALGDNAGGGGDGGEGERIKDDSVASVVSEVRRRPTVSAGD